MITSSLLSADVTIGRFTLSTLAAAELVEGVWGVNDRMCVE